MFAVFLAVIVVATIALGFYMAHRLGGAIIAVAPGVPRGARRAVKALYFAVLYALPAFVVVSVIQSLLTGGSGWVRMPQSAWFDALLLYPFWLTVIWSAQCALFLLPLDLVGLAVRVAAPARQPRWNWWRDRLALATAALFAVYVPARIIHDDNTIEVRHIEHRVAGLPEALEGFRIVLVSDLQADRFTGPDDLERYARAANAQKPDLILMAGDLITRGPEYVELAARYAGRMQAERGVYTSVGDHDNWAYEDMARSVRDITGALAAHGVTMVDNDVVRFEVDPAARPAARPTARGEHIAVIFVTENYMQRNNGDAFAAMLEDTKDADLRVVVTHQPSQSLIEKARHSGVDLYLAGHTHGGQITFLFPFLNLTPVAAETPYVRGHYRLGTQGEAMSVVVSSGLGLSLVPFRYNATPSIEVIELFRK